MARDRNHWQALVDTGSMKDEELFLLAERLSDPRVGAGYIQML